MPENHTPPGPGGSQDQSPPPQPPQAAPPGGPPGGDKSLMLILSYLGLLAIIPLLVEKDKEVQWHSKNGLALFLAVFAAVIVAIILAFVPVLGWLLSCGIIPLSFLGYLVLIVVGIMKALKGEKLRLPVIADLVDGW